MIRSASVDVELSRRIKWLVQLRWLASSAVVCATFVASGLLGLPMDPLPLYLIGAAIAAYNALFLVGLRWTESALDVKRVRHARLMANLQIVTDLVFLTLLVHFSGGVENSFAFYFIFHVIIAGILLSRRETFIQATVANVLFGGLVLGEFMGVIPHVHVFGSAQLDLSRNWLFVGSTLLVFSSTIYLAAYMATSIVGRLRRRDREILGLTCELERKAQELEEAYNRLTELERIKSEYLRKVSHEIREPLVSVHGSLWGLLEGITGEIPPRQRQMVSRAERRIRDLLLLVSDLLILSRAREAKLFTERKLVSLGEIAERVLAAQTGRAEQKSITLSAQANHQTPPVFADPEALEQLVGNLVSNAITYTPGGGRVEVTVDPLGSGVRLQVMDTGIGIPAADLPRIFNEFYRAENARRYNEEGTGLGLSIVRSIVETHGGEIDVDSQVGKGTGITILLPRGMEPSTLESETQEQPPPV